MNEATTYIKNESQCSISVRWGKTPDDVIKIYGNDIPQLHDRLTAAKAIIKVANGLKVIEE